MKAKITASIIVSPRDPKYLKLIKMLATEKPADICLDYLQDALKGGDEELSSLDITVEVIEE